MGQEMEPYQHCPHKSTQHLREDEWSDLGVVPGHYGKPEGDRWIHVSIATSTSNCGKNTRQYREAPARGDDDPSGPLGLGTFQQHVRDNAVTQENQDQGPDELTDKR